MSVLDLTATICSFALLATPAGTQTLVSQRIPGELVLLTNRDGAATFQLMATTALNASVWTPVLAADPNRQIDQVPDLLCP